MKNMFTLILFFMLIPIMSIIMYAQYKYNKGDYDEMQEMRRDKAYKKAFHAIMIIFLIYIFYDLMLADFFVHISALLLASVCLTVGISIFSAYCILNDAYFYVGRSCSIKGNIILFSFLGLFNLLSVRNGSLSEIFPIENDTFSVSSSSLNLFLGLFFITNAATLFIKSLKEKRGMVSEEL